MLPFGEAAVVKNGSAATLVSWGAFVHLSLQAVADLDADVEVIDLRTIVPWDREAVMASVRRTGRLLIVHEDGITAGFGAEIAATAAAAAFDALDAPVMRVATSDCPVPYSSALMPGVVPDAERVKDALRELLDY
jgi:2-oxoisovalerate dehydrogenase E1 component